MEAPRNGRTFGDVMKTKKAPLNSRRRQQRAQERNKQTENGKKSTVSKESISPSASLLECDRPSTSLNTPPSSANKPRPDRQGEFSTKSKTGRLERVNNSISTQQEKPPKEKHVTRIYYNLLKHDPSYVLALEPDKLSTVHTERNTGAADILQEVADNREEETDRTIIGTGKMADGRRCLLVREPDGTEKVVSRYKGKRKNKLGSLQVAPQSAEEQCYKKITQATNSLFVRSYCSQEIDDELDNQVTMLLSSLKAIQDKTLSTKDNAQWKHRRLVLGLKEISRKLRLNKLDAVVIAPNVKPSFDSDGSDESLTQIVNLCECSSVPHIFALSRNRIGTALGVTMRHSAVGLCNLNNLLPQLKAITARAAELREAFRHKLDLLTEQNALVLPS